MEKIATFTEEQNLLIAVAVNVYCDQMSQMASELKKTGDIVNAVKRNDEAALLRDAYCKLLRNKKWELVEG